MNILMVGIDHNLASLEEREIYSFTNDQLKDALIEVNKCDGVTGNVIISTCNRTELWLSKEDGAQVDPVKILAALKDEDVEKCRRIAVVRRDKDAIEHLIVTACGINSRVFGEDQIIAQISQAMVMSRKQKTGGKILEKVFSNSLAAAKKVKTSIKLTSHNPSVADTGVQELFNVCENEEESLENKKCVIIGNGKMAALIAEHLVANKADVYMTLRKKYHIGEEAESLVPNGCHMISYDDRYEELGDADFVISATLSPHYTLTIEGLEGHSFKEPGYWLDLAVPRDIEPAIGEKYNIEILDIDSLGEQENPIAKEQIKKADGIIGSYRDDIFNWIKFRRQVETARKSIDLTKKDAVLRAHGEFLEKGFSEDQCYEIEKIMESATGRAVNKLLFGLKDTLPPCLWQETFQALLKSAEKETLKS